MSLIKFCELSNERHAFSFSGSGKYASRSNVGAVVHSYGDEKLLQNISEPCGPNDILNLKITQVPNDDGDTYNKAM